MRCPACDATTIASRRYAVTEYMLGTGEIFDYEPCDTCGSTVIVDPPSDLARFYPTTYTPFANRESRLLALRRRLGFDERIRAFTRLGAPTSARVLDVGCGAGDFLAALVARGYARVTGIDPFLPFAPGNARGCRFIRGELADLRVERFDVITMHHVIEHVPDPRRFLADAGAMLGPGGALLVRMPLRDSWAARAYGARWFQHDAPRHLVILTSRGLAEAAKVAGLQITASWRDEGRSQAWAGATLAAGGNPFRPIGFGTKVGRIRYAAGARRRNRDGTGDQGCFVLRRVPDATA